MGFHASICSLDHIPTAFGWLYTHHQKGKYHQRDEFYHVERKMNKYKRLNFIVNGQE